jgi:putative protein-disulfide isomerase
MQINGLKSYLLTLIMIICMSTYALSQSHKDTLIYIGDPMCSWCYGFMPELSEIRDSFPNVAMEIIMGGLRPGGDEKIMDLKHFLRKHWTEVARASGQRFNFKILDDDMVVYDTEMSCRAVYTAGVLDPKMKYTYFQEAQKAFYMENILPNDIDAYVQIAMRLGFDGPTFHKAFVSNKHKAGVLSEIELARRLGVSSFPTLIAKIDGKLFIVTNGYQKASKIIAMLKGRGLGD